ncbi:MAG: hypothetical protein M3P48_09695 [Actinomycetota bacterium]|nr:hypothetical protein [Actinomycetota bacterium]
MAEGDDEDEPGVAVQAAGEMPDDLRNYVAVRAGTRAGTDVVQRWVAEVLAWGTTEAEIGTSRTSSDGLNNYIRLYKRGPRHFGAFAYVTPGTRKVNFRLLRKHAEGFEHVTFRNVKPGTGYEVVVTLSSDEAYAEALKLAQVALEGVTRGK